MARMDTIAFRLVAGSIEPVVNGTPLIELARVAELPWATDAGEQTLAGSYVGLDPSDIEWVSDHYSGRPTLSWFDDGDTVLLGCGCGVWGCWPLTVHVDYGATIVRWHTFRNGHREDWDLADLGPFEFGRRRYDAAVAAIRR